MTRLFLAATASFALLSGCDRQSGNLVENRSADAEAENGAVAAEATNAAAPLGAPVEGDRALALMEERHEGMEEIGDAMKRITAELKEDEPDLERVRDQAATITRLAPQVTGWFPPGTGPDVDDTEAKAEIWQRPEDFAAKRNEFQQAAQAFQAALQGSDLAAIRAAHANLGKTCKACHDPYREEH